MKKIIFSTISIAAVLCACNKEQLTENTAVTGEEEIITAVVNADGNKLSFNDVEGSGMTSVWEAGDTFYAYAGDDLVQFELTSGAGTSTATFQTKAKGITESTKWVAVFGNPDVVSSELHCGFLGQNGTLANIEDYSYVKAEATGKEPVFNFASGEKLSYILRVKLPAGIKCVEYTPCGYMKATSSESSSVYYNTGDGNNDYSKTTTITLPGLTSEGDIIYIALPLLNFSRTLSSFSSGEQYGNLKAGVIITILNNDSDNADQSTGLVFEDNLIGKGGLIKTLDMSSMALIHRAKPSDAILLSKTGDIQCKLHSSALTQKASEVNTYWSPCNLGASKPSEVGGYFALGEYVYGKSTYTFPSYTLRHSTKSTNRNDMISVDFNISGKKYGYTICGSRYDAARVLWGQAWRMPHMIEAYAASNGNIARAAEDGVNGVKFGDAVFIPNSRYMDGDRLNDGSTPMASSYTSDNYDCARFWSGDQLNRSYSNAGWNEVFTFGNTSASTTAYDYWRRQTYLGFPIRPVLASSTLK